MFTDLNKKNCFIFLTLYNDEQNKYFFSNQLFCTVIYVLYKTILIFHFYEMKKCLLFLSARFFNFYRRQLLPTFDTIF